ncbi:phosphotransferase family protein [Novosphingobium sp. fls2-241-R2A-195]|uniref:phosphotransferase family protein n=1 Tax=Novosphingobium sp. fls2-241-R2A-195 TaxID=3040296 RepID=UPI00254F3279|nr:phosphotransferase family protein [Novosphingobium sp. fls2-241-R2A-195]
MLRGKSPARLVPTTDRTLRGILQALAEIDPGERTDIAHVLGMAQMVLGNLVTRESAETLAVLGVLEADIDALVARCGGGIAPASPLTGYDAMVARLTASMARLTTVLHDGAAADPGVLQQAEALEARFYAALVPAAAGAASDIPPLTAERFEAYLHARFPRDYERVSRFTRLVGGFQKETILVDAIRSDGEEVAMVIRAEKSDRFVKFTASAITDEFSVVRLMWKRGVPVAEPLWLEADEERLGRRFMVSRRATGRNTGSAYGDSQRFPEALVRSYLDTLARIHNQPIDDRLAATALGQWTGHATLAENTRAEIAAWRHQIWLNPAPASPSFARLFDWLEANVPEDEEPVRVLHNDFGPHNILVEGDTVSAVLDWEIARLGDPAEDLSFFVQCAGSAIDREDAVALYEELSGNRISRFRMAYFDVLSVGKVLVSTLSAAAMYQETEPALIDWMQMPLRGHGAYQALTETRIAAAEAVRGT